MKAIPNKDEYCVVCGGLMRVRETDSRRYYLCNNCTPDYYEPVDEYYRHNEGYADLSLSDYLSNMFEEK